MVSLPTPSTCVARPNICTHTGGRRGGGGKGQEGKVRTAAYKLASLDPSSLRFALGEIFTRVCIASASGVVAHVRCVGRFQSRCKAVHHVGVDGKRPLTSGFSVHPFESRTLLDYLSHWIRFIARVYHFKNFRKRRKKKSQKNLLPPFKP
jgi:hypothetical protein